MKTCNGTFVLTVISTLALTLIVLSLIVLFHDRENPNNVDMEAFNRSSGWYYEEVCFTKVPAYFDGHPLIAEFTAEAVWKNLHARSFATNSELDNAPTLVHKAQFIDLAANDRLSQGAHKTLSFFPDARVVVVNSSITPAELRRICSRKEIIDVCIYDPLSIRTAELVAEARQLQRELQQKRIWFTSMSRFVS